MNTTTMDAPALNASTSNASTSNESTSNASTSNASLAPRAKPTPPRAKPTLAEFLDQERLQLLDIWRNPVDPETEVALQARWTGDAPSGRVLQRYMFSVHDELGTTTRRRYAKAAAPGRHRSAKALSSLLCARVRNKERRVQATFADCRANFECHEWEVLATLDKVAPDAGNPRWETIEARRDGRLGIDLVGDGAVVEILAGRGGYDAMADVLGLLRQLPSKTLSGAGAIEVSLYENSPTCHLDLVKGAGAPAQDDADSRWTCTVIQAAMATFQPRCRPATGLRLVSGRNKRIMCRIEIPMTPDSATLRAKAAATRDRDVARLRRHLADHGASPGAMDAIDRLIAPGAIPVAPGRKTGSAGQLPEPP